MPSTAFIIAIDGYASCGKSTLAKRLALHFGYTYIDSGAMYRAITLFFLRRKISHENVDTIKQFLPQIDISYTTKNNTLCIFLGKEDVTLAIRDQSVNQSVSYYATLGVIRDFATHLQRNYQYTENGIVMDGRDIGTTVFPNAHVKLFMQCDMDVRARRRHEEMHLANPSSLIRVEDVVENLKERDTIDENRSISPLRKPEDAYIVDNTHLTEDELFQKTIDIIRQATT